MDILGQSALVVTVTSFSLGMSVLSKNPKNKLYISFAALTTVISFWALCFFLEKIWPFETFYWWHLLLNVWIAPAALYFIRIFLQSDHIFGRRILDLSIIFGVVLSAALLLHVDDYPLVRLAIYFLPVFIGFEILWQMFFLKRIRRVARARWIYLGGILALCTSTMDHIPELGRVIPSLGNITLTVFIFFLSQAITHQRLLNFGALFSRFLVLLGVALILTGMYSILVAWISDSPELFFLNSFIASFLILTLLDPLRALVGYLTDRLLSQKHHRLNQSLREAQRRLTGILDPGTLFQELLHFSDQTLQPRRSALYLLRNDGVKFRLVRFQGAEEGTSPLREMLADHPLMHACQRLRRKGDLPILLDASIQNEIERSTSRLQRESLSVLIESLRALQGNLLIPLFEGSTVLGFIVLQVDDPPDPWGSNWGFLNILYPFYEQAARTLQSMEIYTRSREKDRLATLGQMAAGLAHEIRNPLGAIRGAAQLLEPSPDRSDSQFLNVIIEEVDRLNRVVTQFLDYSKPPGTDAQPVNLKELIEKTLETLRPSLSPNVAIKFQTDIQGPLIVEGSNERLRQVLINLIQNAFQAVMKTENPEVRIGLERSRAREAILTVEDNGCGIKRENMDKLFIPFFTTSPGGTGLGLPISQKIIEAHRGRIEVTSEEGRYSRFSIVLPLRESAE